MMKSYRILVPISLLLAGAIVGGCGGKEEKSSSGGGPKKPTIAFIMKTLNNPFFVDMEKGAKDAAAKLGVELIVQAPERELDIEKQMQIVENMIQRKVSALCITPSGSKEIVPAIVKANAAGIPVVIVDTRVDAAMAQSAGAKTVSFIGSDNYEGGKMAGEYLAKLLAGQGKVAVLEGIPGHETGDARLKGFKDGIAATPGIQIVTSQTANWERDQGFTVFQNILQSHPDVTGLFACSDLMALGAVEAIAAAGKTGQIKIVGFDANDDAREAIKKGTMLGSVAQNPIEMGRAAVENAIGVIGGKTVPESVSVKVEMIEPGNVGK
ncbi:sugar ABC transporter substrate-binding protein [Candidatus Sumerlaeota bacterium]|nr:sugar ABC transporter substrate-binding protein [Candidatus Sumerlaeota bacterium]